MSTLLCGLMRQVTFFGTLLGSIFIYQTLYNSCIHWNFGKIAITTRFAMRELDAHAA